MPLFIRLIMWLVMGFALGTFLGPVLVMQLVNEGKQVLTPFFITSIGILLASVGFAIGQWRRKT